MLFLDSLVSQTAMFNVETLAFLAFSVPVSHLIWGNGQVEIVKEISWHVIKGLVGRLLS